VRLVTVRARQRQPDCCGTLPSLFLPLFFSFVMLIPSCHRCSRCPFLILPAIRLRGEDCGMGGGRGFTTLQRFGMASGRLAQRREHGFLFSIRHSRTRSVTSRLVAALTGLSSLLARVLTADKSPLGRSSQVALLLRLDQSCVQSAIDSPASFV